MIYLTQITDTARYRITSPVNRMIYLTQITDGLDPCSPKSVNVELDY